MEKEIWFLRKDIMIQKVLFGFVAASMLLPFFLVITLPILGLWQLISGVHLAYELKDVTRKLYLLGSTTLLFVMGILLFNTYNWGNEFVTIVVFIIAPLGIAIWYLAHSYQTLTELEEYAMCQF